MIELKVKEVLYIIYIIYIIQVINVKLELFYFWKIFMACFVINLILKVNGNFETSFLYSLIYYFILLLYILLLCITTLYYYFILLLYILLLYNMDINGNKSVEVISMEEAHSPVSYHLL